MAKFTVRVELHDAASEDYEKLHEEMSKQGFADTITDANGSMKKMPPAEYNYDGEVTREQVLKKAQSGASQVLKSYAVLVTESKGRAWSGLEDA